MRLFKRFIGQFTPLFFIVLIIALLFGGVVYAATWEYKYPIIITNTSNTSHTYLPVSLGFGAQNLVNAGKIGADGLDTNLQIGTSSTKYMLSTTNVTAVIPSIPSIGRTTADLYTGYSPNQTGFSIITGFGGYITTTDDSDIEISTNGVIKFIDTYTDTTTGASKQLVTKKNALDLRVSSITAGTVTGTIGQTSDSFVQVITGGSPDATSVGTEYNTLMGGGIWSATESNVYQVMPTAGEIYSLRIRLSAAVAGGTTLTFTIMKNSVAQALTVTIIAGQSTGSDLSHSVSFVAGDIVSIRSTVTGVPGAPIAQWSTLWCPTIYGESIMLTNDTAVIADPTYNALQGNGGVGTTTELHWQAPMPTAGTFKKMVVRLSADAGVSPDAYNFMLRYNTANTTLNATLVADNVTGSDVVNTVAVVAGGLVDLLITPISTPAVAPTCAIGLVFTSTTAGESVVLGGGNRGFSVAAIRYNTLQGSIALAGFTWDATESNRYQETHVTTVSKLYLNLGAAPDNGAGVQSYTFDIRHAGASTGVQVVVSEVATTGSDTVNTYFMSDGAVVDMMCTPANTPTASYGSWGFVSRYINVELTATGITSAEHDIDFLNVPALDLVRVNSDYISVPDNSVFSFGNGAGVDTAFSVGCWVYLDDATSSTLISKYDSVAGAYREWNFTTNATDNLIFNLFKPDGTAYIGRSAGTLTAYQGQWIRLLATYDGSKLNAGVNLYLNGVDIDGADVSAGAYNGMTNTQSSVNIGSINEGTSTFLDGSGGEVFVWNVALTPAQVLADYNTSLSGVTPIAHWRMNEGTGNSLTEKIAARTGTNHGGDWGTKAGIQTIDFDTNCYDWTKPYAVPDNGNNIVWGKNNCLPYIGEITIDVAGVSILQYKPNVMLTGATLPDRDVTGGSEDGIISWGTNTYVTITYGAMVSYASTVASSNITGGFTMPAASMPSTWFAAGEHLTTLPFYDYINSMATSAGIPTLTIYILIIIGLAFLAFFAVVMYTKSAFMAVLAMCVVLFIGSSQTIVPMWIPFVIMVVDFGIMYLYRQIAY